MSARRKTRRKTIASYYEESDSDFVEEVKRPTKRKKTSSKTKGADSEATERGTGAVATHPASVHIIGDPKPLRTALLDWYAGVHEKRGMPWRKPFNASLNAKGRSQRAYEVRESKPIVNREKS